MQADSQLEIEHDDGSSMAGRHVRRKWPPDDIAHDGVARLGGHRLPFDLLACSVVRPAIFGDTVSDCVIVATGGR